MTPETNAPPPERLILDRLPSPLGEVVLVTDEAGQLRALDFDSHAERMTTLLRSHYGATPVEDGRAPERVRAAVTAYFEGDPDALDGLPWATGGTPFQRRVWRALTTIPRGQTWSYKDLARAVGCGSARAVGQANGRNPVAVVVPCHRVIAADRTLGGYGGGLERKRWLLNHEGAAFRDAPTHLP